MLLQRVGDGPNLGVDKDTGNPNVHPLSILSHLRLVVPSSFNLLSPWFSPSSSSPSLPSPPEKSSLKSLRLSRVRSISALLSHSVTPDPGLCSLEIQFEDAAGALGGMSEGDVGDAVGCFFDAGVGSFAVPERVLEGWGGKGVGMGLPKERIIVQVSVEVDWGDKELCVGAFRESFAEKLKGVREVSTCVELVFPGGLAGENALREVLECAKGQAKEFGVELIASCNSGDGWAAANPNVDDDADDTHATVDAPPADAHPVKDLAKKMLIPFVHRPSDSVQSVVSSFCDSLVTDRPDGLYTTVVTNRGGVALGLVYSSRESIVTAITEQRGIYYSRSRGGIWRKGLTSGCTQTLHGVSADCDRDALRFMVTQHSPDSNDRGAAFCHEGTMTCWGDTGGSGIGGLERTIKDRIHDAPPGSYTRKLLDDTDFLRNKLVEEAQELAECEDRGHAAEELADVLYFALVKAMSVGADFNYAEKVLDMRARKVTRRRGEEKKDRIQQAEEILKQGKK